MKKDILSLRSGAFLGLLLLSLAAFAQTGEKNIEACIETLREEPATPVRSYTSSDTSSYPGLPMLEDFISGVTIYDVGDKEFSQQFDTCLSSAKNAVGSQPKYYTCWAIALWLVSPRSLDIGCLTGQKPKIQTIFSLMLISKNICLILRR